MTTVGRVVFGESASDKGLTPTSGRKRYPVTVKQQRQQLTDGWFPIETAPRGDDTKILAWDGSDVAICWPIGLTGWGVVHDAENWTWCGYTPTHWQPLPEGPTA